MKAALLKNLAIYVDLIDALQHQKISFYFSTYFQIQHFEKLVDSDPEDLIQVSPVTGEIISNAPLDFERRSDVVVQVKSVTRSVRICRNC